MVTVALLLLLTVISLTAASVLGREKAIMMFGCPHHGLTSKKAEHFLFFSQDKFKQTETSQKTGCFAAPINKKNRPKALSPCQFTILGHSKCQKRIKW
jgi:hypothetical protein